MQVLGFILNWVEPKFRSWPWETQMTPRHWPVDNADTLDPFSNMYYTIHFLL